MSSVIQNIPHYNTKSKTVEYYFPHIFLSASSCSWPSEHYCEADLNFCIRRKGDPGEDWLKTCTHP